MSFAAVHMHSSGFDHHDNLTQSKAIAGIWYWWQCHWQGVNIGYHAADDEAIPNWFPTDTTLSSHNLLIVVIDHHPSIPYCILASFHYAKYLVTGGNAYLCHAPLWSTSKWNRFTIIQHDQAGLYEIPKTQELGLERIYGLTFFKCRIIG